MPHNHVLLSASPAETKKLGRTWGKKIKAGAVLALSGTLGSGKTTFVQGLAQGLGLRRKIASPTFITMAAYAIPGTRQTLYHLDLYRLARRIDIQELGLKEIIENKQSVVVIEWAEKLKTMLPRRTKWIHFSHARRNPTVRAITSN